MELLINESDHKNQCHYITAKDALALEMVFCDLAYPEYSNNLLENFNR